MYSPSEVFTQTSTAGDNNTATTSDSSSSNTTSSSSSNQSNATTTATTMDSQQLDNIMKQLLSSDKPEDIATLAYIWGFPLVNVKRTIDFTTSPNLPAGPGLAIGITSSLME
jgi:hypothetical protein